MDYAIRAHIGHTAVELTHVHAHAEGNANDFFIFSRGFGLTFYFKLVYPDLI